MSQAPPPITPPPDAGADGYGQENKSSGLAVAALILGLCGLIPIIGILPGLIGVVLAIVALAKKSPGQGLAVGGLIAGTVGMFMVTALSVSILLPALGRARELAKRAGCMANLNGIGMGMVLYVNDGTNDEWPPDLETLILAGQPAKLLQCPSAKSDRRNDYFYLKPPMTAPGGTIIACDFAGNHGQDYRNILDFNTSVSEMTEAEFQAALNNPINAAFAKALRAAEGMQRP